MFSIYQTGGLALLNALARLGNYKYQEINFGSAATEKIDWYQVDEKAPTVIFYYGGNWRSYRKEDYRFVADTLCGMGVNVAIPDFLKYPEHRFNGILKSVVSATNYFLEKVYTKGPVIIMGHSSGAQMAALVTLNSALLDTPERITAMVGLSGPYDFYPFTDRDHWDLFGPENQYPMSQPVNFVRGDAPELYLLHGADDTRVRRGHSKSLMEKQVEAGGRAHREVYQGMGHADAVVSFSRIHRRKSPLVRDIQTFIMATL